MKKTFLSLALVATLFGAHLFSEEARNALLIANGEYSSDIGKLETPIPEAEALKNVLDELGFTTTIVKNAGRTEILEILDEFSAKTKSERGIAFFHYGGHAIQYNGKNYILPVDANISNEERLRTRAVVSDEIMASMNAAANIIILDSCRNSPFSDGKRGSASRGLVATTESPKNSIIVYSAAAGCTAQDGVFTPILTKKIAEKGKSFTDVLMETRNSVREQTSGQQCPGEYNQLASPIYLAGRDVVTPDMFKSEDADMRIERIYANIEITSEIAGELYIDRQSYGKILAGETIVLNNIPAARYKVEVQGEETISESVRLSGGETTRISLEKKPVELALKSAKNPRKNIFSVKQRDGSLFGELQLFYNHSIFNLYDDGIFPADGFGIDLCGFSLRAGYPASFALEFTSGYTFATASIGDEHFIFHEADWVSVSLGLGIMSRFSLLAGVGYATIWQTFENNTAKVSYEGKSDAIHCVIMPIEAKFRLGENVSLFGKYKLLVLAGEGAGWNMRHSLNVGITINCWYNRW